MRLSNFFIVIVCLVSCNAKVKSAQNIIKTELSVVYSANVKDSFEIYISTPLAFDSLKSYDVVYYCDANIKSGKKIREMLNSGKYNKIANATIFVGIGHIGNYRKLRRRDLVIPSISNGDTSGVSGDFGQAEHFYRFIDEELIPVINKKFRTNKANNSIIGHSFGGLFVFYCLFKNENVFRHYYALSPSLWINKYGIYQFNKLAEESSSAAHTLYFSVGGLEVINFIKPGADKMKSFLDSKHYKNLQYQYQVHEGESHNSQVEKSLDRIFSE